MSLGRPEAALTIDGNRLTATEAALAWLEVDLGLGRVHDRFRAALANLSSFADASADQSAVVELGYGDDLETVLTGTLTAVERHPWGLVLEGLASTVTLSRTRVGRSYVSQSAADIVSDLVSSAQGDAGDVSSSLQLAAFHVDERRSAWSHVFTLAGLAGCEVSADSGGAVNFRPPNTGSPSHSFRHGAELVAWDVGPSAGIRPDIQIVPFGAASEQGSSHWHVLLREPDGGPPTEETLVPGALRDQDGAQTYEQALSDARARRATRGNVLVTGDATVRAGDVVTLVDVPAGDDGPLRVTAATHWLDGRSGFHTYLRVEGAA
jgi:hypothetical protein